jgi:hypothetical protein
MYSGEHCACLLKTVCPPWASGVLPATATTTITALSQRRHMKMTWKGMKGSGVRVCGGDYLLSARDTRARCGNAAANEYVL